MRLLTREAGVVVAAVLAAAVAAVASRLAPKTPDPPSAAHAVTIRVLEEQLRLANIRAADAEQRARRAQPRAYEEIAPIHEMPAGQMENSLRRVYSPEGTEFVMVPNESPMPAPAEPDEEVPA